MNKKEKYYKFELNMTLANIIALVEVIILLIINRIFNWIDFTDIPYVLVFALIIFYTIIHEIFHGISFSFNTKEKEMIKYGAYLEKGVCYAACQSEISKKGIIISLLFPTIILTIVPLPFAILYHLDVFMICILYNFIGAIGDLLMTYFIIKLPKDIKYIDYDITIGATFISNENLEPYSSKVMKLIESGDHKKSNIDKSVKKVYISKTSIIVLLTLLIIIGASLLIDMI